MNTMKIKAILMGCLLMGITAACSNDDKPQFPEKPSMT
jgi:arabinogalactan endo-1,4-beta-galactosidase